MRHFVNAFRSEIRPEEGLSAFENYSPVADNELQGAVIPARSISRPFRRNRSLLDQTGTRSTFADPTTACTAIKSRSMIIIIIVTYRETLWNVTILSRCRRPYTSGSCIVKDVSTTIFNRSAIKFITSDGTEARWFTLNWFDLFGLIPVARWYSGVCLSAPRSRTIYQRDYRRNYSQRLIY